MTNEEAARRLKRFGANRLAQTPGRTPLAILFNQFKSLLVLLLFAAAGIAFATREPLEAGAILVVVVLDAMIGFLTEWKVPSRGAERDPFAVGGRPGTSGRA